MAVTDTTDTADVRQIRMTPVFGVALLVAFVICLPNLMDPMIRHDDYPALLGHADLFWHKTLHEGRWVNYIWHLRGIITPAWLNFIVYQICWATCAACLTQAALPAGRRDLFAAVMVAMILIAPPATLISTWFNTLLPGLALVAAFGMITVTCPERVTRRWLPVFTVLTFMAYTTFPLLLLAFCLARARHRSLPDLLILMSLFAASFIGAVLVTYALNWQAHGVFGVPLADWRDATPARSLSDISANIPGLKASFIQFFSKASMASNTVFTLLATGLGAATFIMIRRAPMEALYLWAGLLTGVALMTMQSLKLGMVVPARAFLFFWVFYAIILVRGVQLLQNQRGLAARLGIGALVILIVTQAVQAQKRYTLFREWQAQTRQTAQALLALPGPVYVLGSAMHSAAGRSAHIQSDFALYFRMEQLSGRQLVMCDTAETRCAGLDRNALIAGAAADWHVTQADDRTVLVIRATDAPET